MDWKPIFPISAIIWGIDLPFLDLFWLKGFQKMTDRGPTDQTVVEKCGEIVQHGLV